MKWILWNSWFSGKKRGFSQELTEAAENAFYTKGNDFGNILWKGFRKTGGFSQGLKCAYWENQPDILSKFAFWLLGEQLGTITGYFLNR